MHVETELCLDRARFEGTVCSSVRLCTSLRDCVREFARDRTLHVLTELCLCARCNGVAILIVRLSTVQVVTGL